MKIKKINEDKKENIKKNKIIIDNNIKIEIKNIDNINNELIKKTFRRTKRK